MNVRRAYATVSFGQVHYRYAGTAGKPIVVLLHQTPSTSAMYEDLMQALAPDYRLFAPDTPGMGMSDDIENTMTIAALARGIAEFIDEVGIEHCCLFGHHTGAAIAAELAAAHPERFDAIALSGPTLLSDELRAKLPGMATAYPTNADGNHLLQMWRRMHNKDASAPLGIVERETINGIQLGERYPAAYDAVIQQDIATTLAALRCPVLVFAGTGDPLHQQLEAALQLLSDGRMQSIDDARTFICETHCPEVAALLRDFFPREAA